MADACTVGSRDGVDGSVGEARGTPDRRGSVLEAAAGVTALEHPRAAEGFRFDGRGGRFHGEGGMTSSQEVTRSKFGSLWSRAYRLGLLVLEEDALKHLRCGGRTGSPLQASSIWAGFR